MKKEGENFFPVGGTGENFCLSSRTMSNMYAGVELFLKGRRGREGIGVINNL